MAFDTTIVFGEIATRRYQEGERDHAKLSDEGNVETFSFSTQAERDAFIDGVEAGSGWLEHMIFEEGE